MATEIPEGQLPQTDRTSSNILARVGGVVDCAPCKNVVAVFILCAPM